MTYREKLELYSQGKLDEQQRIEIEQDLEKQEALADYLFEHQAPPGMEDFFGGTSAFGVEEDEESAADQIVKDNSDEITKQINRSIRKAFIKTGVIAAIAAVVLTLFVVFALPHIVSAFYYDPGRTSEEDLGINGGAPIEQFERDLSVYSELMMPEMGPDITTSSVGFGYGSYVYYIDASYGIGLDEHNEEFAERVEHSYRGTIKRDNTVFFDHEELEKMNNTADYFKPSQAETPSVSLQQMDEYRLYYAYVAFEKELPYEQFYAAYVNNQKYGTDGSWVWCGVRVVDEENEDRHYNEGFFAATHENYASYQYDEDRYPMLAWTADSEELNTEEKAATHLKSMMSYLDDNDSLKNLSGDLELSHDLFSIDEEKAYISENGLHVYGCIYVGDKSHIENIAKAENIRQVVVREAI